MKRYKSHIKVMSYTQTRYLSETYASADIRKISSCPHGYPWISSLRIWYGSNIHYPQFADMVLNLISNGEDMPQSNSFGVFDDTGLPIVVTFRD
jgi:hypothetical protein